MRNDSERGRPAARALRYGGYAAALTAGVLALLVGLNVLAARIPLRVDLTAEGFSTLSEQSRKVLGALDVPVGLVALYEPGREDARVDELLKRYRAASERITVTYLDPYRSPVALKRYEVGGEPPDAGSVIVDAGGRFRVLKTWELYELTVDEQTQAPKLQSFQAEQAITSAIVQVTAASDPVVYLVRGHGERDLPADLGTRLAGDNFVLRNLDLAVAPAVPDDATVLVLLGPKNDLSAADAGKLRDWLAGRGGRAVLTLELGAGAQPVLAGLLAAYGLASPDALVVEQDGAYHLPNQPVALVPGVADHAVTATLKSGELPVVFPVARPLVVLAERKRRVTVEPLLGTSARAFAQVDLSTTETARGPRDLGGPFVLAAVATDLGETGERESRILVLGSTEFLFPPESIGRLPENENLLLNGLNWLRGEEELIAIRPRSISSIRYTISMTAFQFYLFAGIAVVLVPLAVFATGLAIWLRRRHA
jgi:hypothetical protein